MAATDTTTAAAPAGSTIGGLVRAVRPKQWLKNVLVLAAPAAAGVLDQAEPAAQAILAFGCFSAAAGGTYLLNDARDAEADRRHPTKRHRPVAAGAVSPALAASVGAALLAVSVAGAAAVRVELALTILAYVATTTVYTLWAKHVTPLDIVFIASGFVLRAIAGAAATDVPISDWFFIVASFGSLFMVAGKRSGESAELGAHAATVRSSLGEYTDSYLNFIRSMSAGVVLVAYCLWAFERADEFDPTIPWFQITVVPFGVAILRYAMLIDAGRGAAPEELVLSDRILFASGAVWAIVFALGIYTT